MVVSVGLVNVKHLRWERNKGCGYGGASVNKPKARCSAVNRRSEVAAGDSTGRGNWCKTHE